MTFGFGQCRQLQQLSTDNPVHARTPSRQGAEKPPPAPSKSPRQSHRARFLSSPILRVFYPHRVSAILSLTVKRAVCTIVSNKYLDDVAALRDPGFNVTYWNLHNRVVRNERGTKTAWDHRLDDTIAHGVDRRFGTGTSVVPGFLQDLWMDRPELQDQYPDPGGQNISGFVRWGITEGSFEVPVAEATVPMLAQLLPFKERWKARVKRWTSTSRLSQGTETAP